MCGEFHFKRFTINQVKSKCLNGFNYDEIAKIIDDIGKN